MNRAIDRNIEHLVQEIGQVIEKAPPEERDELRQMASDLVQQEKVRAKPMPDETPATQRPLNLIALGGVVLVFGAVLSVLIPQIGLLLVAGGLATILFRIVYRMIAE